MPIDIRLDHLQIVRDILKQHVPNHKVMVFGSRAKFTAKHTSDLDLCIMGNAPLSLSLLGHLRDDFSESNLPYKVDLVDWYDLDNVFKKIVKRDMQLIQRKFIAKSSYVVHDIESTGYFSRTSWSRLLINSFLTIHI